jgi:hypothetical protein
MIKILLFVNNVKLQTAQNRVSVQPVKIQSETIFLTQFQVLRIDKEAGK